MYLPPNYHIKIFWFSIFKVSFSKKKSANETNHVKKIYETTFLILMHDNHSILT